MENKVEFVLATCLKGGKFEIADVQFDNVNEFIQAAEAWPNVSPGGDALVINKGNMEILWPERLKGKKVEAWH